MSTLTATVKYVYMKYAVGMIGIFFWFRLLICEIYHDHVILIVRDLCIFNY